MDSGILSRSAVSIINTIPSTAGK